MTNLKQFKALCVIIGLFVLLILIPPVGFLAIVGIGVWWIRRGLKAQKQRIADADRARYVAWRGHPSNQQGMSIEEANAYRRAANEQRGPRG
jgi:putative Mn2+ efflux pump MntP